MLESLAAVEECLGSSLGDAAKVRTTANMHDLPGINKVDREGFPEPSTRITVGNRLQTRSPKTASSPRFGLPAPPRKRFKNANLLGTTNGHGFHHRELD